MPIILAVSCGDIEPLEDVSYSEDIQPIFDIYCLTGCHDGARLGSLELTSYALLREGGDQSDLIIPGNAESSPFMWYLQGYDMFNQEFPIMPPVGRAPLADWEIRLIRNWIDRGALNN